MPQVASISEESFISGNRVIFTLKDGKKIALLHLKGLQCAIVQGDDESLLAKVRKAFRAGQKGTILLPTPFFNYVKDFMFLLDGMIPVEDVRVELVIGNDDSGKEIMSVDEHLRIVIGIKR